MKLLLTLNPEGVSEKEVDGYGRRTAARAVVVDGEGKLALLHVARHGYYKLPGGGVDEGEDVAEALRRECLEEIGCEVEVKGEVGMVVEWRKMFELHQTSFCFWAKVKGEKGKPAFTDSELANGFEMVWVEADKVLPLMEKLSPANQEGRIYIVPRDICLLKEALPLPGEGRG
ncbi:MAG: NUDIX domain-containing protein [Proteobacteria bacterium]|nr:NUDIX domain-containing protein [Pseudomonadota bacterium]